MTTDLQSNTPDKAFDGDRATICEAGSVGQGSYVLFTPPADSFTTTLDLEVGSATDKGVEIDVIDKDDNVYAIITSEITLGLEMPL